MPHFPACRALPAACPPLAMPFPGPAGIVAWRPLRVRVQPVCSDYDDLTARWGVGSLCRRVSARFLRLGKRHALLSPAARQEVSFLPPRRWQAFPGSAAWGVAPGMCRCAERRTVRSFLARDRFRILARAYLPGGDRRATLLPAGPVV